MLKQKNIIVTGCLSGIGRATLKVCACKGANVIACAYKKTDEFEEHCKQLSEEHDVQIVPVYFDLMSENDIKRAVREIQALKMEIHGLINIAGINRDAYLGMISSKDILDTFQVNVFSQIMFTQYVVKLMLRGGHEASIAFVSSISALDGNEGQIVYSASKAALLGAVRSMAKELGPKGVRVNAIAPGVIITPMTDPLTDEIKDVAISHMDIKRLGTAGEVGAILAFLMSDMSSHITGQTIRIDGGIRG